MLTTLQFVSSELKLSNAGNAKFAIINIYQLIYIICIAYAYAILYAENSHLGYVIFEGGLRIWNAETKSIFLRSEEKGIPGMHYCLIC